jgi:hypothetical protein
MIAGARKREKRMRSDCSRFTWLFSAADSGLDEVIDQGKEAIELWIEITLDRGQAIPKPSSLRDLQKTRLDAKAK